MTVIAIWHEDSPTTESFDMQMWASTAQKIGPGKTLEAEESTYKNEIDRNMKIHEGMYFPCNVPPSFRTSQNCLDFLVLTKIGLKRIRIKWCERFSDFNRMWGKDLQNFKSFITKKSRIAIFFEIAEIPGKKCWSETSKNWPQKRKKFWR